MASHDPVATTQSPAVRAGSDRLDAKSFAALFSLHYQKLWLIAAGIAGDRGHADDLVQEAAVTALEKLDQFAPGTDFVAWLAKMMRLKAMNAARTAAKRSTTATDPVTLDKANPAPTTTAHALAGQTPPAQAIPLQILEADLDDDLLEALASITETARACLLLRAVMDMTYAEIATIMEIPEGTAMSHVHRAKQTLRRRLESKYLQAPRANEASS